jgi:glycosyltransferase involved in cell wall biosynthesis
MQLEPEDEIVICDAGSTDRSIEIEKKYADVLILYPLEKKRPITRGKGRQIATEHAQNSIVISTDGDCVPPENYVYKIKEYFYCHPEVTWISGDVLDLKGRLLRTAASLMAGKVWHGGAGCNSAFRREIFETLRGYKNINWFEDTSLFSDFPPEKHFIDNPILMDLSPRFTETYWIAAFTILGISYSIWKVRQKSSI